MPTLNKLWAGKIYGTNTGNLFIEFTEAGPKVVGIIRFRDDALGVVIYKVSGTFDEGLKITGVPQDPPTGVVVGNIEAEARLTPEGHLRGQWQSTLGTGGTFEAYPHDVNSPHAVSSLPPNSTAPEQIFSRNIPLRALRLFADDLRQLIAHIKEDFTSGRVVVTYNLRGSQVTRYGDQFLAEMEKLDRLNYLKINIQELEAHGINRVATVELSAFGTNEVRVQGIRESWVIGKAEAVVGFLRQHDSAMLTTYRKFGLNLNSLIFVTMLIIMPGLASWQQRAFFALGVIILLALLFTLHVRLIPNTLIILGGAKPTFWSRMWPQILSGIVTLITTVAGGLLLYWLTKETPTPH
jgi:hypothetical protein